MVTYGKQHVLFRILGYFAPNPGEAIDEWGVGFRIALPVGPFSEARKDAFLASIEDIVGNFHTNSSVGAGSNCWLEKLTAAYIDLDGKYMGGDSQPTSTVELDPHIAGNGTATFPFSQARVHSMRTQIERGRGSRGRIYYPNAQPVTATGVWAAVTIGQANTAFAMLVDGINAAADEEWGSLARVSIMSGVGTGEVGTVIEVATGSAPDTQRRRDKNVPEAYNWLGVSTTQDVRAERAERQYSSTGRT